MQRATDLQKLIKKTKLEYERKFIVPLLMKFTRPPQMFDSKQIRLRKQIESDLDLLDSMILCDSCAGSGTMAHRIEDVETHKDACEWTLVTDNRVFFVDTCPWCLGKGLVIPQHLRTGVLFPVENSIVDDEFAPYCGMVCPVCNDELCWRFRKTESDEIYYSSTCHGHEYTLYPNTFHLKKQRIDS